jgi:predicted Zn-dependent protease
MTEQSYFYDLADAACAELEAPEILMAWFAGEHSDFVRFNQSRIRQAGNVFQGSLALDLMRGRRHAQAMVSIAQDMAIDIVRMNAAVASLREQLPRLPEDPYLLYATEVASGDEHGANKLPDREEPIAAILEAGTGRDLVGFFAQGAIFCGFANSLGQRNWFSSHNFHFSGSFYHAADKAVKTAYAGFSWSPAEFERKIEAAAEQLSILKRRPKTIEPGRYRVYLAPSALEDVIETLASDGFSLKAHRTKTTALLRMIEEKVALSPHVTITENTAEGIAPHFQAQGFLKPGRVPLIERGRYRDTLVSPRSAKEYGIAPNGAAAAERPESLDMEPGAIPAATVLARLDTGIYINQTWYLNFSDRPACRMTGMTRFATFWVEHGKIAAPLNVMRFDETLYRALGSTLIGLTVERDFIPSSNTYGGRSTTSMRLPGALIDDFTFTL